jgi:N-acetylneuraminic acid mutarotase
MAACDPGGDAIYLFGGCGSDSTIHDSIMRCDVDPLTGEITSATTLGITLPLKTYSAGCVYNDADGKIYIFGGFLEDGSASDAVYAFTPESMGGPAIDTVASLPSARAWSGASAVNGKIYCLGGESTTNVLYDEVLEYDPIADSWTAITAMLDPRLGAQGAVVNGRIYICGGFIEDDEAGYATSALVESFDPADPDSGWRREEAMSVAKYWHSMESFDGKIYLFGGYDGPPHSLDNDILFSNVVEYSPVQMNSRNSLPENGQYAGATAVINDKIYIFGGYEDGSYSDRVLEYDAAADVWTPMDAMPHGPVVGASAVTIGQTAMVMSGRGTAGVTLQNWNFDPAQPAGSQWTRLADMPEERFGAAAVYYDDSALSIFAPSGPELAFVIGGQDFLDVSWETTLMYDITADAWYAAPFMPLPRGKSWATAAIVDNKIYSIGGMTDDAHVLDECLVLDIEDAIFSWIPAGQMPTARYGHGSVVIGDRIYSVGGFYTDEEGRTTSSSAVEYLKTQTKNWTVITSLAESRGYCFVATSPLAVKHVFIVIGGFSAEPDRTPNMVFLNEVLEYNH